MPDSKTVWERDPETEGWINHLPRGFLPVTSGASAVLAEDCATLLSLVPFVF